MPATAEPKVVHATCVVERSLPQPPAAVFAALSTPDQIRRWMGGGQHSEMFRFQCDVREGGSQIFEYKMGPGTPIAGCVIANEGRFQQIVPDERIVIASTMKRDGRIFSASLITFELVPAAAGTDLILTHQGAFFEGADGPAMREEGWNKLADNLVALLGEQ